MARAVGLAGGTSGGQRALAVDWGYSNATLCIVGEGRPLYARRIHDCGFSQVLDAIMRTFGIMLDESQHLVDTQGVTAAETTRAGDRRTQTAITDAAGPTIEELVRQIARTLQFMESQRRHLHPAAIWLMGGGASMANIGQHLAQSLHVPVHIWKMSAAEGPIRCAADQRSAVFGAAVALSALAWGAAA
jgi:Tfp pilus assembly PilM family ATPase